MTTVTIEPAQRTAAKVAGASYLIAMATSMFAELYARAPLIVTGNAAQTAINIAASERLFRVGSVIHLITFASDAVLAVTLYVAFSYLWLRSRYIPRALAVWGIFASLALAFVELAILLFPGLAAGVGMAFMAPMGIYEVGLGLWLLIKGLP